MAPAVKAATLLVLAIASAHANAGYPSDAAAGRSGSISPVIADPVRHSAYIQNGGLRLHVRGDRQCAVDSIWSGGRLLSAPDAGGYTGFLTGSVWHTSKHLARSPLLSLSGDSISIRGIRLAAGKEVVTEAWTFAPRGESVVWTIERTVKRPVRLDDNAFPAISVAPISQFDGALLGNGGVAWFRLFNDTVLAFGVHTDGATLWSAKNRDCLALNASTADGACALNTSKRGETATCAFSCSPAELGYRFDAGTHRRRFIRGRTDVWQRTTYPARTYRVSLSLSAPDYQKTFARGEFRGIDGEAVTSIANTIARLGVIDSRHYGGNSWHTPYGPICLHEQYIAQFGIAIDDPNYIRGYRDCLDFYRDHAILPDGRVKSRWAYSNEDAAPGTADSLGFYEAQWGMLMDSQPDFVINVAEEFDLCGDLAWLRSHKKTCESALDYMLKRDSNHNHLVEMATRSHTEARGSDWIDVIWASWENAFVNVEVYRALTLWSDLEELMGDTARGLTYRAFAAGLKTAFNRSVRDGGFWDDNHRWYVHWREQDGLAYGNNLVVPVNFMAIGYGLCEDPARKKSILDSVEAEMQKEHLFIWPICMYPYEQGVGLLNVNYPYPNYENGDLFLSWAELGMKAYAAESPDIAFKYCRNMIDRYRKDGLAFQRYLRKTQEGAGDDILAGNASAVVGLYTDIFGIQPRYNRLLVSPHLVKDLYGTTLVYRFQGKTYSIRLEGETACVSVDGVGFTCRGTLAVRGNPGSVTWYAGGDIASGMMLSAPDTPARDVIVDTWAEARAWRERAASGGATASYEVFGLIPGHEVELRCDTKLIGTYRADAAGRIRYCYTLPDAHEHAFVLAAPR